MKKPSDFTCHPYSSIFKNAEHEIVAFNIMKILVRTGNEFKLLSFEEYKIERLKDGNFTDSEETYFNNVIKYCKDSQSAETFSKEWNK